MQKIYVAPRAGAWIETDKVVEILPGVMSPPVRGRGLKLNLYTIEVDPRTSPPVRGRGLKLISIVQ